MECNTPPDGEGGVVPFNACDYRHGGAAYSRQKSGQVLVWGQAYTQLWYAHVPRGYTKVAAPATPRLSEARTGMGTNEVTSSSSGTSLS